MRMRILPTANPLKDFADASCFLFFFLCQGQCDEDVIETNCMYFNWRPRVANLPRKNKNKNKI